MEEERTYLLRPEIVALGTRIADDCHADWIR